MKIFHNGEIRRRQQQNRAGLKEATIGREKLRV